MQINESEKKTVWQKLVGLVTAEAKQQAEADGNTAKEAAVAGAADTPAAPVETPALPIPAPQEIPDLRGELAGLVAAHKETAAKLDQFIADQNAAVATAKERGDASANEIAALRATVAKQTAQIAELSAARPAGLDLGGERATEKAKAMTPDEADSERRKEAVAGRFGKK